MDIDVGALREGLLNFIVLVLSLSLHEWGHAIAADKLGDDTPRSQGRVTLYPMAHIDLIGTIIVPAMGMLGFFGGLAMIGWAKPVWTNPANFRRGNFDRALVTIAGPGVNFMLALFGTVAMAVTHRFVGSPPLTHFFSIVLVINVALMVFNLLPIPPLDGSKFLVYLFGMSEEAYAKASLYGDFALLILINLPPFRQFVGLLIGYALGPFDTLLRILT
jgi:Zn-dependent protease